MNMFVAQVLKTKTSMKRFCKVDIMDANKLENVYLAQYQWEVAEEKRKKEEARLAEEERKRQEAEENG